MSRRLAGFFVVAVLAGAQPPAVTKILSLFAELNQAQSTKKKVRFRLTESDVNSYVQNALQVNPRPGLDRMRLKFFPSNYVSTLTMVDFDLVERMRPGTVPTLLRAVLQGKKEIWVDVRLRADGGVCTFSVEKAYFQNIRLPAFVVEKLIHVVGARQKEKFDTTKPIPLPFGLQSVVTGMQFVSGEN